jgi:hypothetical protein
MSENVGALISRNPKGLHGLYRDNFTVSITREEAVRETLFPLNTFINKNIIFLDIIHCLVFIQKRPPVYLKKQRFGDWILSPSSGRTYSVGPNR